MRRWLAPIAIAALALTACGNGSTGADDDERTEWFSTSDQGRDFRCLYLYRGGGGNYHGGPAVWCYEDEP